MRDHRVVLTGIMVTSLAFLTAFSSAPHFSATQPVAPVASAAPAMLSPDAGSDIADEGPASNADDRLSSRSVAGIRDELTHCVFAAIDG